MIFLDNNGHTFKLDSYPNKFIGYEYEENDYVFWINETNTDDMSIDNYYAKVINLLIPINDSHPDNIGIELNLDSKIYNFISPISINDKLSKNNSLTESINIDIDTEFKQKLTSDDLLFIPIIENNKNYLIVPIYIVGKAFEEGTWISNSLIHVFNKDTNYDSTNEDWCSISIGGTFVDECEPLIINGKNMGIDLPKDILKAIYTQDFDNQSFNYQLFNQKIKEYLLNYMNIKGQQGNFKSAINSLKWFEWGKHITISKLLQTDNQIQTQFVRDYFDFNSDLLKSFETFRNSTYISLTLKLNRETGKCEKIDFNKNFTGEGNPELENLLTKNILVHDDINEYIEYVKPYYNYSFTELGLKLACLKYYYNKYFLPIHLSIKSLSTEHKVYINKLKMINKSRTSLIEPIINLEKQNNDIEFNNNHILYLTKQIHYVDDCFNEFSNKNIKSKENLYYINDTCTNIPIKFKDNKYYNCVFILEKENNNISKYVYTYLTDKISIFSNIKLFSNNVEQDISKVKFAYSFDNKIYSVFYDNYNKLINNLIQTYSTNYEVIEENENKFAIIDNEKYLLTNKDQTIYKDNKSIFIQQQSKIKINSLDNTQSIYGYSIDNFYIQIKYENQINEIYVNYNDINLLYIDNEIKDRYIKEDIKKIFGKIKRKIQSKYDLIYESHFQFFQKDSTYKNFVIYPKMINKDKQFNYWINQKFIFRALINNKWYKYEFQIKIQEPQISFGTLQYKYKDNNIKFNQIKDIVKYENGLEEVFFNSYIRQPNLVTINHIDFFNDYMKYIISNNIQYIDGSNIKNNDFYYYIIINDQTIRFHESTLGKNIILSKDMLTFTNLCVFIYGGHTYIMTEDSVKLDEYTLKQGSILGLNDNTYLVFESDKTKEKLYLIYDKNSNSYIAKDCDGDNYSYPVYEMLHTNINGMLNKYSSNVNIVNNRKYLNNIHLFNIYHNTYKNHNIFYFNNNIYQYDNNILLTYDNYYGDNKLFINTIKNTNIKQIDNTLQNNIKKKCWAYYINTDKYGNETLNYSTNIYSNHYETKKLGYATYLSINNFMKYNEVDNKYEYVNNYIYKSFNDKLINNDEEIDDKKYSLFVNINDEILPVSYKIKFKHYNNQTRKYDDFIPVNNEYVDFINRMKENKSSQYILEVEYYMEILTRTPNKLVIIDGTPMYNLVDKKYYYEGKEVFKLTYPIYHDNITNKDISNISTNISTQINVNNIMTDQKIFKCKFEYESSNMDNITASVQIKHNDDNITEITENKTEFEINKDTDFSINIIINITNKDTYINDWIQPFIYVNKKELLRYEPQSYSTKDDMISITINNKQYEYGYNNSKEVVQLYKDFFTLNEELNEYVPNVQFSNSYIDYDFYLMHDDKYWFGLFISKNTLDKVVNLNDIEISNYDKNFIIENKYELEYVKSSNQFLINRMDFIPSNGINQFNNDDIIVCKLENNDRLPVNIFNGSKWKFDPLSVGLSKSVEFESNNEMAIFSMEKDNNKYSKGYYMTTVRYSVDANTNQQFIRKTKIRID